MPRVLTEDKARPISVEEIEKDDKYDLNSEFKAESDSLIYTYNSQDDLVLWTDFCGKDSYTSTIDGIAGGDYVKFAKDRSENGNDNQVYGSPDLLARRVDEASLPYILSLIAAYVPGSTAEDFTRESIDMCGTPCSFFNISSANQGEDDCVMYAHGSDHLYISHNTDLTHTNSENTSDEPFSISLWYYPVDTENNPYRLYDKGGEARSNAPTILHKAFEYALYIRECGKLEFVLYDINIDAPYVQQAASQVSTFNGTASTLTCRSNQNVLKPGQWNHITITYDGSGARNGMKIYVNCIDETNPNDIPATRTGAKTYSPGVPLTTEAAFQEAYDTFSGIVYHTDDDEDPSAYTNMKTFSTPLVFASSAYPGAGDLLTTGGAVNNLQITDYRSFVWNGSQLPLSLLFDFAMWKKELDEENIIAICNATRYCAIKYSIRSIPYRDSGYINLSPKVLNRIRDQKRNELSVIDRIGDRSDRRVKERPPFNDRNTIFFGDKTSDHFKKGKFKFLTLNLGFSDIAFGIPVGGIEPDNNKWEFENALIKREKRKDFDGEVYYDKALTLSGEGQSWIQTKNKVNNAILYYDLILGPYNQSIGNLNLSAVPKEGANLYIQVQIDEGDSWVTVKTHSVSSSVLALTSFYSPNFNSGIILNENQHKFRRSFSLHFNDIDTKGQPYKIRFMTSDRCWGIGKIEILSANQTIRPPLLIDHDAYYGKEIDKKIIATPHTRSDLETTGRSVSGISDTGLYFSDEVTQRLLPFKDNTQIPFSGKTFFDSGVDPEILPGFSSNLKDKTQFTIEINANSEKEVGFSKKMNLYNGANTDESGNSTDFLTNGDDKINALTITNATIAEEIFFGGSSVSDGQPVNVFWNNTTKEFENGYGFKGFRAASGLGLLATTTNGITFSSIDTVGTGSTKTDSLADPLEDDQYFGNEIISSFAQPVKSQGFPTLKDYGPGYDNAIKMSDYITKPFILEKVVLEFDSKFEFAKTGQSNENAVSAHKINYNYYKIDTDPEEPDRPSLKQSSNNYIIIPSFTLMKVNKNVIKSFYTHLKFISGDAPGEINYYNFETNSYHRDQIENEIITYGQVCLYASGSGRTNVEKLLNSGLSRDLNINILEMNGQSSSSISNGLNAFTSSLKIETPVRTLPVVSPNQRVYMRDIYPHGGPTQNRTFSHFPSSQTGGRSVNNLKNITIEKPDISDKNVSISTSNKGLINNQQSTDKKNKVNYKIPSIFNAQDPIDAESSGYLATDESKLISPYILNPSDRLTLTFHYPIPQSGYATLPGSTDTLFNKMTIGKNIKIHLFGSQVQDKKEFHETMNQALTTAEIGEVIGSESITDQFNVFSKDEYHKTFVDRSSMYAYVDQFTLSIPILGNITFDLAKIYTSDLPKLMLSSQGRSNSFIDLNAKNRIGLKSVNKIHKFLTYIIASGSIDDIVAEEGYANFDHEFEGHYLNPIIQPKIGSLSTSYHEYNKTFTFPFFSAYNNQRSYFDEGLESGETQQIISKEKYTFSHKHFGHYADIIDFAKDSKYSKINSFGIVPLPIIDSIEYKKVKKNETLTSPVSVTFVTGSYDSKSIKSFYATSRVLLSDTANISYNSEIDGPFTDRI